MMPGPSLNGQLEPYLEYMLDLGVTGTDLDLVLDWPRVVLIYINSSGSGWMVMILLLVSMV